ncbi:hypothetical protein TNCV_3571461 [Trichonephila clavipes]|nr:hypothetical protein TNCV_3571461 [Trichonephila clavipes]
MWKFGEEKVSSQMPSSFLDHGSKLRGLSPIALVQPLQPYSLPLLEHPIFRVPTARAPQMECKCELFERLLKRHPQLEFRKLILTNQEHRHNYGQVTRTTPEQEPSQSELPRQAYGRTLELGIINVQRPLLHGRSSFRGTKLELKTRQS